MKIATTIGEMYAYTSSVAEAVRQYKDTGFRYLDYSFYNVITKTDHPFMSDDWKNVVLEAKEAADELEEYNGGDQTNNSLKKVTVDNGKTCVHCAGF